MYLSFTFDIHEEYHTEFFFGGGGGDSEAICKLCLILKTML